MNPRPLAEMLREYATWWVRESDECEVMDDYMAHERTFLAAASLLMPLVHSLEAHGCSDEVYAHRARKALSSLRDKLESK